MRKLTELELMKHWLDAEISIIHIMIAAVMHQLVETSWVQWALVAYMVYSLMYALTRIAVVSAQDRDFLRIPKK